MFPSFTNYIKFGNGSINVTSGANTLGSMSLCSVKIPFQQYQKNTILLPKGQTDFLVTAPMMGIKTTFLVIKPKYSCSNNNSNFLKWKFQNNNNPKMTMTNILVLSGSTTNPIPPIVLDNPNLNSDIEVEILISAMGNDYLNDINAYLYLNNLLFDSISATNNIFSFYNSNNELAGTLDVSDIVNIIKVPGENRIIIDESSDHNIVLDFKTELDVLQALSAINWFLLDSVVRVLPQPIDVVSPVITYTTNIINDTLLVTLGINNYTKTNFINDTIINILDVRDGQMIAVPNNITFKKQSIVMSVLTYTEVATITLTGNYLVEINISDIAGNLTTKNITLIANV
jgi:hypothetical protein